MASIEELRGERLKKLEELKGQGANPYPAKSNKTHFINEAFSDFENLMLRLIIHHLKLNFLDQ